MSLTKASFSMITGALANVLDFGAVGNGSTDDTAAFTAAIATGDDIYVPDGTFICTIATAFNYYGPGIVQQSAGVLNNKANKLGNIGGNIDRKHFEIGCIPRCIGGVFSILDDAGHHPLNVTSVSQPTTYALRVNYSKTATKINSFIAAPDAELAPYGIVCGGDVGLSYADVYAYAPLSFFCNHNATPSLSTNNIWAPIVGTALTISTPDAATVIVQHPSAVINDCVTATIVSGSKLLTPVLSFNSTEVNIIMHGDASGFISYSAGAWSQTLSDNLTAPVLTWTAGDVLRVDHGGSANLTDRTPLLTGHGGIYIPQITDVASTYFEVAFYDYSGTKITTQDTNMKFWYRRNLLVPSIWPTDTTVSVMRGLCPVTTTSFSNVAGNNFWIAGTMEY